MSYLKSFPKCYRKRIRLEIADALQVSDSYLRSMACGVKPFQAKYVRTLEIITKGAVRRWDMRPDIYPREEYEKYQEYESGLLKNRYCTPSTRGKTP